MFKTRFISMLVLLAAVVTGATAQTEELLTTITMSDDFGTIYSVSGRATLSTSGLVETGMVCPEVYGWSNSSPLGIGSVTITAAEGYEITKVVFWDYDFMEGYRNALTDNASPFTCYMKGSQRSLNEDMSSPNGNAIAKIEVYGYAPTVAVTGVTLAPTSATLTLGETETVTLTATVLPGDATDKTVTWTTSNASVATVADGVVTAVAAGEATITVTTTDGAKTATCAVTVAAPAASTYTVTLKEGTDDATSWTITPAEATTTGVAAGTEVKATYGGTKKVKSVKAKKKAAATPALSITSPSVGQVIGSDGKNYSYASLPTGVTAVAKICYVSGSNGLALALTDEGKMNWSTAQTACAAHTAPFTGGTWKLATKDEWNNMIYAAGGLSALKNGFSSVGGTNMQSDDYYWSSTEYDDPFFAWYYDDYDLEDWDYGDKDYDLYVRACLAF